MLDCGRACVTVTVQVYASSSMFVSKQNQIASSFTFFGSLKIVIMMKYLFFF